MAASLHLTPEQTQAARDILMRQARAMAAGAQQAISGKYDKEELTRLAREGGDTEAQIKALLTPDQQAGYPSYQQEEAAHTAGRAANTELRESVRTLASSSGTPEGNRLGSARDALRSLLAAHPPMLTPLLSPSEAAPPHRRIPRVAFPFVKGLRRVLTIPSCRKLSPSRWSLGL